MGHPVGQFTSFQRPSTTSAKIIFDPVFAESHDKPPPTAPMVAVGAWYGDGTSGKPYWAEHGDESRTERDRANSRLVKGIRPKTE